MFSIKIHTKDSTI